MKHVSRRSSHQNSVFPPADATPPAVNNYSSRLRVRYCECDPMGVAHHAAYAPWLEIGRTELLRAHGVSYKQLEHAGVFLVITRLDVRYRRPILYDDIIDIRTTRTGGSRVKIEHAYELVVVERDNAPLELSASVATTTLACVNAQGQVTELPPWLAPQP